LRGQVFLKLPLDLHLLEVKGSRLYV
jgi:hypothetical protein